MTHKHAAMMSVQTPVGEMVLVADGVGLRVCDFVDRRDIDRHLVLVRRVCGEIADVRTGGVVGEGASIVRAAAARLEAYFAGEMIGPMHEPADGLPGEVGGVAIAPVNVTAFFARAWMGLLMIPPGETRSYSQQASMVGSPKASRAVARANGQNFLSVLIPCHRVIGANGALTGYGGGLERKRALLALEGGARWPHQQMATWPNEVVGVGG
jgi:O-6-methylguanine DNA methyltransferase